MLEVRAVPPLSLCSELVEEAPGEKAADVRDQEFLNPWIVINADSVLKHVQTLSEQLQIVLQSAPGPTSFVQFCTQRPDWMVTASCVLSQCNQLQRMLTQFGSIQDDIICLLLTLTSHACLQDAEVVTSTLRIFYEWIQSCLPAPAALLEVNPSVVSISTTVWIQAMGRQWTQLEQLTATLKFHQHLFDRMTDNARNIYPPLSLLPDMIVRQTIGSWQMLNRKFRSISVFTVGQNTGEKWNMSEHVCDRCVGCDPLSPRDGQCEECLREYFLRTRLQQWTRSLFPFVKELVMGERQVGARWTPGMLCGPSGSGRRTLVHQLAHLLGRRLVEYSTDKLTTHWKDWSNEIEQKRLQSSLMEILLACFRSGSFLLIPDMHLLSLTTLPFLLGELEKLKSCPLATYDGSTNLKAPHHKRHLDFSITSDGFNPLKCSWKTITVSDRSVTIRPGFGLMFTGDQYKISNIPDSLRGRLAPEHLPLERAVQPTAALDSTVMTHGGSVARRSVPGAASMLIWNPVPSTWEKQLRIAQMNVPEWTFTVDCICANYLPGYRGTRVRSRLKHMLEIAHVPWNPRSSTPTINSILSWPLVCAAMTYAYRWWNKTFRKLIEDRPQKSLQSSLVHRGEEDQLAEQAIVYGFIQAWSGPFSSCEKPSSMVRRTTLGEERILSMRAHFLRGFEEFHATETDRPISNVSTRFVYSILQQISLKGLCVVERQVEKVLELGNLILEKRPILILGSVGSGKSTTLALLAGSINSSTNYFSKVPVRTVDDEIRSVDANTLKNYLDTTMPRSFREWLERQRFTDLGNCPLQSAGPVKVCQIDAGIHSSTLDEPILHDCKEWVYMDLGDSFSPNVNQQILSTVKSLKDPNRRFLLEKTHVDDISPAVLHRFAIFSMDSEVVSWRHRWRTWCQAAVRRFALPKQEWPVLVDKMETCLAKGILSTFQLVADCYSTDKQQSIIGVHQKPAFEQQCTSNVLSLLDSLLERFFPRDVWEWRKIGHCPPRQYQSVHRRINRHWPSWRRPEDRVEFHSQLIKYFFVFAFIWGVGGRFAGDPRLRTKFQALVGDLLNQFLDTDSPSPHRIQAVPSYFPPDNQPYLTDFYPIESDIADQMDPNSWLHSTVDNKERFRVGRRDIQLHCGPDVSLSGAFLAPPRIYGRLLAGRIRRA
ncbi:hypothetical protein T265_05407 [Opisthorchis viverrini]|uniref:AAA+ ATPase domain-containing protein n=1 Tax=Opisthorchis viverrini TaxID=6198 RepID=A0A074ZKM8_OPIVI|nr:hypothetical protein T265_05407 [Opisthorchis viverrini]KER27591.1 hypothetical protein T265_05407 [Opisthorchis viverrini]